MKNTSSIRTEVMRLYNFIKHSYQSKSEAMRQSWLVAKAKQALKAGEAIITFTKKGDDVPSARFGTLCADLFSYESKGTDRKQNPLQVFFYDTMAGQFKSFIATSLIQFKAVA